LSITGLVSKIGAIATQMETWRRRGHTKDQNREKIIEEDHGEEEEPLQTTRDLADERGGAPPKLKPRENYEELVDQLVRALNHHPRVRIDGIKVSQLERLVRDAKKANDTWQKAKALPSGGATYALHA
jgi:hypothetical protein